MSKTAFRIIIILLIGGFIVWSAYKRATTDQFAKPVGGGGKKGPVNVTAIKVSTQQVNRDLQVSGTILPFETVDIKAEVSGLVEKIHFSEGQRVEKGQLLISLRADDLKAQIQKVKHNLKLAEVFEERQRQLLEKEAISRQEFDQAETNKLVLKSDLALLKAQLEKTEIRASFSGQVGLKDLSEGAYLQAGTTITTLVNANPVKLEFQIPVKYSNEITTGMEINFTSDASTNTEKAKVIAMATEADLSTRNITVRALAPNNNGRLKPGTFANVIIPFKQGQESILIPTECIVPDGDIQKVFVIRQGKAYPQPVKAGIRFPNKIEILDGLKANDSVVTTGVLLLRPEAEVRIIKS